MDQISQKMEFPSKRKEEKENNQAVYQRIGRQQTDRKQNLIFKKVGMEPSIDISKQQIQQSVLSDYFSKINVHQQSADKSNHDSCLFAADKSHRYRKYQ